MLKSTEQRMIKMAQFAADIGDPVSAGRSLSYIINFLMGRIKDPEKRQNAYNSLREKLWTIDVSEISANQVPDTTAIGQSVNMVKNVLMGYDPNYIRQVITYTLGNL